VAALAVAGFNQIFLIVYMSIWLRRSNVMTGAEWIQTRFGKNESLTAPTSALSSLRWSVSSGFWLTAPRAGNLLTFRTINQTNN
jgi:hypothetical protein